MIWNKCYQKLALIFYSTFVYINHCNQKLAQCITR